MVVKKNGGKGQVEKRRILFRVVHLVSLVVVSKFVIRVGREMWRG